MKDSTAHSPRGNLKAPAGRPGLRRQAREAALQCLFQLDAQGFEATSADSLFWRLRATSSEEDAAPAETNPPPLPPKARSFAETLVSGVCKDRIRIDGLLEKCATNFRLERLAAVDRNILRMAVYELLHKGDAPPAVVINEAIEIAKRFGTEDSGRFVNGVLDRIKVEIRSLPREPETPAVDPVSAEKPAPLSDPLSDPLSAPLSDPGAPTPGSGGAHSVSDSPLPS
jgi:N utilization substance protein B